MEELKELRNKLNLTQKEMAEKLGISLSYYTKFEQGVVPVTISLVVKIKEVFGADAISIGKKLAMLKNKKESLVNQLVYVELFNYGLLDEDNENRIDNLKIEKLTNEILEYLSLNVYRYAIEHIKENPNVILGKFNPEAEGVNPIR